MQELQVAIPIRETGSYKIKIGTGVLDSLWPEIDAEFDWAKKFIVTDENLVSAGHLEKLVGQRDIPSFVISPAGETSKNIETVVSIIETMEKAFLGRDTAVVCLGGGTVGDVAGFAAAIFKRGVTVIQIPTTTVAQADSAIGGKTGVDSTVSKNAFGAFWQPAAVFIDVATLTTLDDRQFRSGLVESVKHALIADEKYFVFLENNMDAILQRKFDVLEEMAYFNCRIKAAVVETDPTEKNRRRILNYGHTIGHAVESASGFEILHGEAIAIGIVAAGLIEKKLQLAETGQLERIKSILRKLGVPVVLPTNLSKDALLETIKHDKKSVNQWPRFVLLSKIGQVYCHKGQWAVEVEPALVEEVLAKLRESN